MQGGGQKHMNINYSLAKQLLGEPPIKLHLEQDMEVQLWDDMGIWRL